MELYRRWVWLILLSDVLGGFVSYFFNNRAYKLLKIKKWGYFKNEKQSKITRDKCRRQQGRHVLPLLWTQKPQCTQHRWNSSDKNMLTTESWALPTISPSHVSVSGNVQTHGGSEPRFLLMPSLPSFSRQLTRKSPRLPPNQLFQ